MLKQRIANLLFKVFLFFTCRIDTSEFKKIPLDGPGIFVTNHTTIIEGPLYYVMLYPRRMTALAKIELWKNPVTRFFMNAWNVIPLKRGGGDREAVQKAAEALESGMFLGIAPEGTRSRTGALMRGHRGAAYFAAEKKVPIYPIAQWGLMHWPGYLCKFKRCPVHIRIGDPFFIENKEGVQVTSKELGLMTDEIMYKIAELLPPELRGYYADESKKTDAFIIPVSGSQ